MMKNFGSNHSRDGLVKSARVLRAYFEHKYRVPLELLLHAPLDLSGHLIPFGPDLRMTGMWGLRSTEKLGLDQEDEVLETFKLILGSLDGLHTYHRELGHLQSRLEMNSFEQMPSNVIPLRRDSLNQPSPVSLVEDRRWILRLDCLIESKHISEIHKMALELHSHGSRYAFIEYRDLSKACRASTQELLSLGAISLFIPNILDLRLDEQAVLKTISETATINRPLLMVGTTAPFSSLRGEPGVDLEFLLVLSRAYIKLTRPFSEYKDQGLIHYFLDSLSENPS